MIINISINIDELILISIIHGKTAIPESDSGILSLGKFRNFCIREIPELDSGILGRGVCEITKIHMYSLVLHYVDFCYLHMNDHNSSIHIQHKYFCIILNIAVHM